MLTNCDTHENFPPGIFKAMPPLAKLPGGMSALAAPFRIGALARAAFRPFARTPIPAELVASWMEPGLQDRGVKRDAKKVTAGMNKRYTLEAAEKLRGSELPILLTWAPGDRFFPITLRRTARRRSRQRPDRPDPRREDLRPARPAAAPRRRDRGVRRQRMSARAQAGVLSRYVHVFRPTGGAILCQTPYRGRRAMPKEIFDQDRPRSTMAQRLDEAFAGCDQWTVARAPTAPQPLDVAPSVRPR